MCLRYKQGKVHGVDIIACRLESDRRLGTCRPLVKSHDNVVRSIQGNRVLAERKDRSMYYVLRYPLYYNGNPMLICFPNI